MNELRTRRNCCRNYDLEGRQCCCTEGHKGDCQFATRRHQFVPCSPELDGLYADRYCFVCGLEKTRCMHLNE